MAELTFVNTTNAPALSRQAAKLMRGHVTKINFTRRRQRKADRLQDGTIAILSKPDRTGPTKTSHGRPMESIALELSLAFSLLPTKIVSNSYSGIEQLARYWSLAFLEDRGSPRNGSEVVWFGLFLAEPALIEVSLAICERHWSPDAISTWKAAKHWDAAFNIVIERIRSEQAHSDGVLGAVYTMAFGERLAGNELAWNVHIDGIAQLISNRHARGITVLPSWFSGLLILDSANAILGFPRIYHRKIMDALWDHCSPTLSKTAAIVDEVVWWRNSVHAHRKSHLDRESATREVEVSLARLLDQVRALCIDENPYVQLVSRAIELVLHLSRAHQSGFNLTFLASEMKEWHSQLEIRSCEYMDLTSCYLMVGAISAERGTETRAWFVGKLRKVVLVMQRRGWDHKLRGFEKGFTSDTILRVPLEALWVEINVEE